MRFDFMVVHNAVCLADYAGLVDGQNMCVLAYKRRLEKSRKWSFLLSCFKTNKQKKTEIFFMLFTTFLSMGEIWRKGIIVFWRLQ